MSTEHTQEIEYAASEWLIRRDGGTWTLADEARFQAWLDASTLHRVAYLRLELAWEDAARLKALGAGITGDQPPLPGQWNLTPFFEARDQKVASTEEEGTLTGEPLDDPQDPEEHEGPRRNAELSASVGEPGLRPINADAKGVRSRRRSPLGTFALAASILLALGGAYLWRAPGGDRYATAIGGIASVPMTDGSRVTLNTDTQIRVDLTASERRIELKQGEAFFEVAKDPSRPFVVHVGGKRVTAVGTKFSVRRDNDDIEVVVTEGQVRVDEGTGASGSATPEGPVFLTPGAVAHASTAGVLVRRETVSEAERQLSWRAGILMFRDQTLAEAVAEFNRYNQRKIVIEDPKLADLRIEGNFRATNVDAFVRLLESGFAVRARTEDARVLLTAN
jgi:transmembrane sensor